jgi:rRNA maturation protein Rpf1
MSLRVFFWEMATDLVIAHEHRGEPDGLVVCHLPHGPTAYFGLSNAVLRWVEFYGGSNGGCFIGFGAVLIEL